MNILRHLSPRLRDTARWLLPLGAGLLFVPFVLMANWLITGAGPGDLLSSSSVVIIYYPPLLGLIAAFSGHFRVHHAAWPLLGIAIIEILSLIPGAAPLDLLGIIFQPIFATVAPDVLGKSLLVGFGALAALGSLLVGITIFRLVAAVMTLAQCITLVLFHLVAFSWPFDGIEAREMNLLQREFSTHGTIEGVCDFEGRVCKKGTMPIMLQEAHQLLPNPDRLTRFLQEHRYTPRIAHSWLENPSSKSLDRIHLVTVQKIYPDYALVMISSDGPSLVYAELRKGAGVLIAIFHQAWISLVLLILFRHGDYRYEGWRWRRVG